MDTHYSTATIDGVECLSMEDAANFLGVSNRYAYYLINRYDSPLVVKKWGGKLGVTLASLEAEKARRNAEAQNAEVVA